MAPRECGRAYLPIVIGKVSNEWLHSGRPNVYQRMPRFRTPQAVTGDTGDERCDGRLTDLWHVWNTLMLARQLGAPAPDLSIGAPA